MVDHINRRPSVVVPPRADTAAASDTPPAPGALAAGDAAAPVDVFGAVPGTPSSTGSGHGVLPDVLLDLAGTRVVHGDDPGDFYCEHMFYTAQLAARQVTSVATNPSGEKLVGFLHVPWDDFTSKTFVDGAYTQDRRHGNTRQVIGAALRGYSVDAFKAAGAGPIKMMVTGYGPFSSARDNPTGDFVKHPENLDAAMAHAFGDLLITKMGTNQTVAGLPADTHRRAYQVRDKKTGQVRDVVLQAQWFPVTDDAIDGAGARSIQKSMEQFGAHAVVSMGVHSGKEYLAEHHADDGGLELRNGRYVHDYAAQPKDNLADNYALPRAILEGEKLRAAQSPVALRSGGSGGGGW